MPTPGNRILSRINALSDEQFGELSRETKVLNHATSVGPVMATPFIATVGVGIAGGVGVGLIQEGVKQGVIGGLDEDEGEVMSMS